MNLSFKVFLACLFMTLIAFSTGCSSLKHANAKDRYITNQMQNYTFGTSCANVMAGAKQLLFTNGYQVKGAHATNSMETEWGMIDANVARRYLVTTLSNTAGQCSVHFDYVEETHRPDMAPTSIVGRDYVMEYTLLRRLEPESWRTIETAAEAYADAHDD